MTRKRDRVLRLRMDHRMRSNLDLSFLTWHASLRFNHDFVLGAILALVTSRIELKLVRDDFAPYMLLPNEIREAFCFLQINHVIQTLAVPTQQCRTGKGTV